MEGLRPGVAPPAISCWMERWPEIEAQIAARPRWLLAVGFEGLLAPVVPRPEAAPVPDGPRSLLTKLGASGRVSLAFVSGRPVQEIQARVGMVDAFYAGNHGMEIRGPGVVSREDRAVSCRSDLVDALVFVARCTKRLPGVLIEDKGLTVSVHWRSSDAAEGAALRALMAVIVKQHPRLTVVSGPGVWELRPRAAWNKGNALKKILAHLQLTTADTIYLGDEFTDEDAFVYLSAGLTFCVGKTAATAAHYRLGNAAEAGAFLFCAFCSVNGVRLTKGTSAHMSHSPSAFLDPLIHGFETVCHRVGNLVGSSHDSAHGSNTGCRALSRRAICNGAAMRRRR